MAKHLERDLENLQRDLLALASSVEEAIHQAIRALREREPSLARQVIAGDNQIDQEENHIEEECLKILALHQPVAVDLRRIAAVLKINTDLERMADLAEDIAERALHLAQLPAIAIPEKLQRMTKIGRVCVFCGSSPGEHPDYARAAREVGTLLARESIGLVYGGGDRGLMARSPMRSRVWTQASSARSITR